jgi:hypothetical protein
MELIMEPGMESLVQLEEVKKRDKDWSYCRAYSEVLTETFKWSLDWSLEWS